MARVHYWHYLLNEEGQQVPNALISVQEAGTATYLWVYTQETGGTAIDRYTGDSVAGPQLRSGTDGYFEFWIADSNDTYGYGGIKIKISWSLPGVIDDGSIDNIEFTISPEEVLETDTDTVKNKLVSNLLAYGWEAKADMYSVAVSSGSLTPSGGQYYYDITHNLGNAYPLVMVYDDVSMVSIPVTAGVGTVNQTRIYIQEVDNCHVTLIG